MSVVRFILRALALIVFVTVLVVLLILRPKRLHDV